MPTSPITILLIDDTEDITTLLETLINRAPDLRTVGTLHAADTLTAAAASLRPDVVVLDLTMPGKDPLAATRELAAARPQSRVIIYSAHDTHDHLDAAIEAGAWAYISKSAPPSTLLDAIRQVAAGHTLLNP